MPPRQLDFCTACQAPIYMETVEGACSCQLGALRAIQANLLLQNQQRIADIRQGRTPAPPSLSTAIREVVAARNSPQSLENILMAEARRVTGQVEVTLHTEEPVSPPAVSGENYQRVANQIVRPGTIIQVGPPFPVTSVRREYPEDPRQRSMMDNRIALEQLWMNREDMPEEAWVASMEAEFPPGGPLETDHAEIQFDDGGLGIEFENSPDWVSSAPRMRVDRPIQPREPFNARMTPGYADGEVVGNVRERNANLEQVRAGARGVRVVDGSMRQIRERAQAQSRDDARQHGLVSTRQASRAEVERVRPDRGESAMRAAEEAGRPTVYDRLRKGILDDD